MMLVIFPSQELEEEHEMLNQEFTKLNVEHQKLLTKLKQYEGSTGGAEAVSEEKINKQIINMKLHAIVCCPGAATFSNRATWFVKKCFTSETRQQMI